MKRSIISILLLLILIFPVTGYLGWLQLRKALVEKKVEKILQEEIGEGDLVLLKFTPEQSAYLLTWEHPGEFEFGGEMYDVYEIRNMGDTIYYHCWWDREETALNHQMEEMSRMALPGEVPMAKAHLRLTVFISVPFLAGPLFQCPEKYQFSSGISMEGVDQYQSIYLSPPHPPPRKSHP